MAPLLCREFLMNVLQLLQADVDGNDGALPRLGWCLNLTNQLTFSCFLMKHLSHFDESVLHNMLT